jgi:hypothetical protein
MTALGVMLFVVVVVAMGWPEHVGRWCATIVKSYREAMK